MKVCGIVCEYNPFHNGHKHQIDVIKNRLGYDTVVGVMSGNFTQRGDVAVFDKSVRANAAIMNGMDLVVDLPTVHALQSAEIFAENAVFILNALGVDALSFGSESEDLDSMKRLAQLFVKESPEFVSALKSELRQGKPYHLARSSAASKILGGGCGDILKEPNNILAIEYLKALLRLDSPMIPHPIKRDSSHHNDSEIYGSIASATAVRSGLKNQNPSALSAVPDNCGKLYKQSKIHNIERLSTAIISKIILSDAELIRKVPDVSEGLENKIKKAARDSKSFSELCDNIKSKRYAHSRIRRILINFLLGITADNASVRPQYIKILGFGSKGQMLLNHKKKTCPLPLAKNRNAVKNNPAAAKLWDRELQFDMIYKLSEV